MFPTRSTRRTRSPTGRLLRREFQTALGPMVAVALVREHEADLGLDPRGDSAESICLLEFADRRMLRTQLERIRRRFGAEVQEEAAVAIRMPVLDRLERQLAEYLDGERREFDLPIAADGTAFQAGAWSWLRSIPYGETRTYGQGAVALGRPTAVRAFARANGDNRLAILVPCHRIVGADGDLTGYGGGLWRKRALLDLEAGVGPGRAVLSGDAHRGDAHPGDAHPGDAATGREAAPR